MSGSNLGNWPVPNHQLDLAEKQARILNCPTDNSSVIVACLRTKSYEELGNSLGDFDVKFAFCYRFLLSLLITDCVFRSSVLTPFYCGIQLSSLMWAKRDSYRRIRLRWRRGMSLCTFHCWLASRRRSSLCKRSVKLNKKMLNSFLHYFRYSGVWGGVQSEGIQRKLR